MVFAACQRDDLADQSGRSDPDQKHAGEDDQPAMPFAHQALSLFEWDLRTTHANGTAKNRCDITPPITTSGLR
jgi:hypothetical protein